MGKITIHELSNSLNNMINEKQTKNDNSLETTDKTIVGAINEIYDSLVNNNDYKLDSINGKKIIAEAIGEPLDATDTFNEMSNDIGNLLSQFKVNMMNNGVTVDSGDKFKQLIDKIATMVEEGSGKGIQFVRKDITLPKYSKWLQVNDLGFKANIVMYDIDTLHVLYNDTVGYDQLVLYPIGGSIGSATYSSVSYFPGGMYINENGFKLPIFTAQYTESNTETTVNKTITIIAIGIGEEDNTLRDSLASILEDEGVSVTPEDDMASLIEKTDNEFQENTTILYNKMKDANYNVNSSMNMDALLNELNLKSKIEGSLNNQGIADESSITFTAKNLEFTPSLVYVTASGVTEQIDDEGNMRYYNTLIVTNKSVYTGASSNNTIKVNILNKGFEVKFTTYSPGYNSYLRWITINGVSYIAIR